jgi:hypothetical protein
MPDGGLQWNCAAIYPERTLNLLVPEMPEVSLRTAAPLIASQIAPWN